MRGINTSTFAAKSERVLCQDELRLPSCVGVELSITNEFPLLTVAIEHFGVNVLQLLSYFMDAFMLITKRHCENSEKRCI